NEGHFGHLYSHTLPGRKLDYMRKNLAVCLEVDEIIDTFTWRSVVAQGIFEEVTDLQIRKTLIEEFRKCFPQMTPVEDRLNSVAPIVYGIEITTISGRLEG